MRAFITTCIVAVFASAATGCHSSREFLVQDRDQIEERQRIYEIRTIDGRVVNFESDSLGYALLRDSTLERFPGNGVTDTIPLSTVSLLRTNRPEPTRTLIAVLIGTGVGALLVGSWIHGWHSGSW
jgi:hypothetical protein